MSPADALFWNSIMWNVARLLFAVYLASTICKIPSWWRHRNGGCK